jgi:outer membrane protein assembly factor BamD
MRLALSFSSVALVALAIASGGGLIACAAFETNLQDTEVDQKDTARQNFESAESAFEGRRFNEAVKYFELVKNKFPYSKFAVLSELRMADTHFEREKWLEAADAYRIFVRFHPRHEQVAYATYRVAVSHSRAIEENVAWLPFVDAREKDQSSAKDTIRACDDFLTRFPEDERAAEVRALRTTARSRLADVDLYAARFYEDRQRWQGAVWRYQRVGEEFADTPQAAPALFRAGLLADQRLEDAPQARALYERVMREHPNAEEAALAKTALSKLPAAPTTAPPPPTASAQPG